MQKDLDLRVPIEAPRLDELRQGGHRIGDPAPRGRGRSAPPEPRTARPNKKQRREAMSAKSVYVANLPWSATVEDVQSLFGRYGKVHETTIITDRRTGRSKGFGFVDMPQPAAQTAIEALHGSMLGGRDLTVRFAQPRRYNA